MRMKFKLITDKGYASDLHALWNNKPIPKKEYKDKTENIEKAKNIFTSQDILLSFSLY